MTKPRASQSTASDSQSDEEIKPDCPSTAKDLFADFAPDDSDKDDDKDSINVAACEPPSAKKAKESSVRRYTPKYRKEWEKEPELKPWLSESIHGNTYFYCRFCKKDYRSGISDIHKHMSSKKHALRAAMPTFTAQKFKFRGLLCPVFTPFAPFESVRSVTPHVNKEAIAKYAKFLHACGIKGILINDIMGEGMSMTIKERIEVTDAWADACEKYNQFLMVQIGGAPLKDVIEMAKHAAKREVGAAVILPDVYSQPSSHIDLIKYLKLVSDFTRNVPILYHHNPKYTHVEVDITSFLLDMIGEIDTFVGLIYSTNDIQQSTAALTLNREKITCFMGTDQGILGAVANGFTCIMSPTLNFLPKLVDSICQSVREGDLKGAQMSQSLLNKVVDMVGQQGHPVAAFKAATDIITNTCGVTTREPIQTLWDPTIKKMQTKLRELGVM